MRLTSVLPHSLHLLEAGRITVARARAFATELECLDDELAGQLDCDLADRVATLAPWRIKDEVPRAALALDPETAALRKAAATAERDVVLEPMRDGQAYVVITGPAVPLVRWYATVDDRARALRQAGDPHNLAALRFDLATSAFPCRRTRLPTMPDAELRKACVDGPSGQVLDLTARDVRPPPTPAGVRQALLDMATQPTDPSGVGWRTGAGHDPSEPLHDLVGLRDRACDGPTQPHSRVSTCDLDHDRPYPAGPTAAWNLVVRSRRTHQLKHYGWTPIRAATETIWSVLPARSSRSRARPDPPLGSTATSPDGPHTCLTTTRSPLSTPICSPLSTSTTGAPGSRRWSARPGPSGSSSTAATDCLSSDRMAGGAPAAAAKRRSCPPARTSA